MVAEAKLGEGRDELTTPDAVVLLLVIEGDKHMITDAETLKHGGGKGLSCDRDAEVLLRTGVGVRRRGGRAHGVGRREAAEEVEIGSKNLIP